MARDGLRGVEEPSGFILNFPHLHAGVHSMHLRQGVRYDENMQHIYRANQVVDSTLQLSFSGSWSYQLEKKPFLGVIMAVHFKIPVPSNREKTQASSLLLLFLITDRFLQHVSVTYSPRSEFFSFSTSSWIISSAVT